MRASLSHDHPVRCPHFIRIHGQPTNTQQISLSKHKSVITLDRIQCVVPKIYATFLNLVLPELERANFKEISLHARCSVASISSSSDIWYSLNRTRRWHAGPADWEETIQSIYLMELLSSSGCFGGLCDRMAIPIRLIQGECQMLCVAEWWLLKVVAEIQFEGYLRSQWPTCRWILVEE